MKISLDFCTPQDGNAPVVTRKKKSPYTTPKQYLLDAPTPILKYPNQA